MLAPFLVEYGYERLSRQLIPPSPPPAGFLFSAYQYSAFRAGALVGLESRNGTIIRNIIEVHPTKLVTACVNITAKAPGYPPVRGCDV